MHKILIAEDDVYLREAYETILVNAEYEVKGVENGKIALNSILNSAPDLLLLDMLMPVMSGLELLEQLSLKKLIGTFKIVAFTNLSDKATIEKLTEYGVDKYLLKSSIMPKQLVEIVGEQIKSGTAL